MLFCRLSCGYPNAVPTLAANLPMPYHKPLRYVFQLHRRVGTNQPLPAYRETAKALALGYARFLQQGQSTATGTHKYKFGVQLALVAAYAVAYFYLPGVILIAFNIVNIVVKA
jgi:hypothetical protein